MIMSIDNDYLCRNWCFRIFKQIPNLPWISFPGPFISLSQFRISLFFFHQPRLQLISFSDGLRAFPFIIVISVTTWPCFKWDSPICSLLFKRRRTFTTRYMEIACDMIIHYRYKGSWVSFEEEFPSNFVVIIAKLSKLQTKWEVNYFTRSCKGT